MFAGLNPERVTAAALSNGISRYALEKAVRYATERQVFNVPIGAHQGLSHPLAQCLHRRAQARLMTAPGRAARRRGREAAEAVNIAKSPPPSLAATLDQAIQTHGGNGISTEYGLAACGSSPACCGPRRSAGRWC